MIPPRGKGISYHLQLKPLGGYICEFPGGYPDSPAKMNLLMCYRLWSCFCCCPVDLNVLIFEGGRKHDMEARYFAQCYLSVHTQNLESSKFETPNIKWSKFQNTSPVYQLHPVPARSNKQHTTTIKKVQKRFSRPAKVHIKGSQFFQIFHGLGKLPRCSKTWGLWRSSTILPLAQGDVTC